MKNDEINKNRLSIDIENIYENDYKLMKIISQTKEKTQNNISLTEKKKNLKNLMSKIKGEYEINNNEEEKVLCQSNEKFHNEYNLFNKKKSKKDVKSIFKDLVKLYKSRGYRIPNFSINEHNIFKANPLLEGNTTAISNGILANQLLKKYGESEKIINYLKKLGIILSEKLANDDLTKNLKKLKISRLKYINEEDSVEALKKQIEILTNLINTNALDKLDEPKKTNFMSYSRQSSINSNKNRSNKKLIYLNKQRLSLCKTSRMSNKKLNNALFERRVSTDSSMTAKSIKSINIQKKKSELQKTSDKVSIILNFNKNIQLVNTSKTPKEIKIPTLDLQKINQNKEEKFFVKHNKFIIPKKPVSEKMNNIFTNDLKTPRKNKNLNWTRNSIKDMKTNLLSPYLEINQRHLSTTKKYSNNSSLSEEYLTSSNQTGVIKKNEIVFPYTNKNEFINFAYSKFSKKGFNNCEDYIKKYLNKVKKYDDDNVNNFFKNIYDKNIKNNFKELENQITENDIYCKTERLYLNNHLIKRIKSTLKHMNEKDKIILKLEKLFTRAVINK